MKRINTILYASVLAMISACSSSGTDEGPDTGSENRIDISTCIVERVHAKGPALDENGNGNFSDGDVFTLLVSGNGGSESDSFSYTYGKTQLYWKDIATAHDGDKVCFSACYPQQNTDDGKFRFDLATVSDRDLLLALAPDIEYNSADPVKLDFRHAMHRLILEYTVESDIDASEIQTTCTAKSDCTVNLLDGSLDTTGSETYGFTETGSEARFLIVPQNASGVSIEVKAGNVVKTFALDSLEPGTGELKGGMQLTVRLTVKEDRIEISGTAIEGWEDQGTVGGEILI